MEQLRSGYRPLVRRSRSAGVNPNLSTGVRVNPIWAHLFSPRSSLIWPPSHGWYTPNRACHGLSAGIRPVAVPNNLHYITLHY